MARSRNPLRIPFVAEVSSAIKSIRGLDQEIDKLDGSVRAAQEAFKGAGDATDQAFDGAQDSVAAAETAMRQLGIKSEHVADNQIAKLLQSFQQLKASGAASAAEIARAYENMQNRIQRINAQVGRGVDGLGNHYRTLGLRSVESAKQQVEAAQRAYEAIRNSDADPEEVARAHAAMQAQIKQINASIGVDIRELEDHYRALGVTSVEAAKKQAEAARQAAQAIRNSKDARPEDVSRSQDAANEKIRQYYAALGMDVRTLEEHYQALGVTSTATANKQVEAARRSYEAVANSDAPIEDVARAYEGYQAQVKAANASIGKDVRTLEDHFRALGVTSVEAIKKQAEAARQAAAAIASSKDASPEDITRSQEAANEKTRQYYAALGMDIRTLEELYKSLGVTSTEAANQQIAASLKTYEAIKNSDAPIEDVTRAWEAHQATVKAANASIGKDVRTLEDHYRELGIVSDASAEKQVSAIRETASTLRASANGPKELARITAAEGERIKAVYTSIGARAKKTLAEISAQARRFGEGIRSIGSSMSWQITAPITVGLGAALKGAGDFEAQMQGVKALLGDVSDKEFAKLGDAARTMGREAGFGARDTAAAMNELASQGLNTQQILGGALKATASAAAASGSSIADAATLMTQASNTFGIDASKMGVVANRVAGLMDVSRFGVTDFSLALSQGGLAARQAKMSLEEYAAIVALAGKYFDSGSDAGTSFKTFIASLAKDTDSAKEAMEKIGFSAYDASGNMVSMEEIIRRLQRGLRNLSDQAKQQVLNDIFGSDAGRIAFMLATEGVQGYGNALKAVFKGDAAKAAQTRMEGFNGQMKQLRNALEELGIAIGKSGVLKMVTDLIKKATEWVEAMSKASPTTLKWLVTLAAIAAVIGPVLVFFGQMTIGAAMLVKGLALVGPAVSAIIGALGGITLIGAGWAIAIGLAIGAVVATIWLYRDQIMTTFGDLMRWMQEYAGEIGKWALRIVAPLVALIWENRDAIIGALSAMLNWIYETFGPIIDFFAWVGKGIFTVLFEPFQDITRAIRIFINTWRATGYSFVGFWQGIGGALYAWLIEPWERWYKRGKALLEWMIEAGRKAARWLGITQSKASSARGYSSGGYTGNGGVRQIAGYVHGKEFVLRAAAVAQYPRAMLEQMNRGTWRPEMALAYAEDGGRSGLAPVNVSLGGDTVSLFGDQPNVMKIIKMEARQRAARQTSRVPEW